MVFTIQFCKEFSKVGLTRVIGGLLGLAFTRELTPVICAIVLGRVGSAIAAELGTMQVSEQVDQLRTLGSDPVDYLVAPRVVACAVSLPILSVISFTIGMAASILLADLRYDISPNASGLSGEVSGIERHRDNVREGARVRGGDRDNQLRVGSDHHRGCEGGR